MGRLLLMGKGRRPTAGGGGGTATWNNADKDASITLSGSPLLTMTKGGAAGAASVRATNSASSGKKFWQCIVAQTGADGEIPGIGNASAVLGAGGFTQDTNGVGLSPDGNIRLNSTTIATVNGFSNADTVSIAVDLTAMLIWFRTTSGLWNNSGTADPATGVGGISISGLAAGPYFPMATQIFATGATTANFGATTYSPLAPSGFGNW